MALEMETVRRYAENPISVVHLSGLLPTGRAYCYIYIATNPKLVYLTTSFFRQFIGHRPKLSACSNASCMQEPDHVKCQNKNRAFVDS